MKKLCFIGNSHLGALHKAWTHLGADYPDVSIEYFAARKTATRLLNVIDSKHHSTALEGIEVLGEKDVVIDDHDIFVIVALGFSVIPLMNLYRKYRADCHTFGGGAHLVSDACFEAAARGLLTDSIAARTASIISGLTEKPVIVVGQARPSEHVLLKPEGTNAFYHKAQQSADDVALDKLYRLVADSVVGSAAKFIDQPAETRSGVLFTSGDYGVADPSDTRDGSSFSVGDFWHMNVRYGKACLRAVLDGCIER